MPSPFPPGINFPPIDFPPITPPPPSPVHWLPPPPPSNSNNSTIFGFTIAFTIAFGVFFLMISCACKLCDKNRGDAEANGAEAANTALAGAARPPSSVPIPPEPWYDDGDEGRPRRVSPAAGLPSFPYNRSVRRNVAGGRGEEEEASCSVCLGAFQTGETVRLLPVCLHLFHVECIDPWLDMHSTCPICRSGIDPTTDGRLYPPV